MMIRLVNWTLCSVMVLAPSFASSDNGCSLEVNEGIVLDLLETATSVQLGRYEILVPKGLGHLDFKVSNGRGQFEFRFNGEGYKSESAPDSTDREGWAGLRSMIFTVDVKVGEDSEVFTVSHHCVLADIPVFFIAMKGLSVSPNESNIVLLRFEDGTSVLIFGEGLNEYLEALRRVNNEE